MGSIRAFLFAHRLHYKGVPARDTWVRAELFGLPGARPETCDPQTAEGQLATIRAERRPDSPGEPEIAFNATPTSCFTAARLCPSSKRHDSRGLDAAGEAVFEHTSYSTGGSSSSAARAGTATNRRGAAGRLRVRRRGPERPAD